MLSSDEARAFYDRFGARQDSQAFYEDPATRDLIVHADFEEACAVFEFGCGTGRFAQGLLSHHLPLSSWYRGVDLSATMIELARNRLNRFEERATVTLSDGTMHLDAPDGSVDRVVSNYVLDLLPEADIVQFISEAARILSWDGCLCLVSLTHPQNLLSRVPMAIWRLIHRLRPILVGGCRPIDLAEYLPPPEWNIIYRNVLTAYGIPSEIVVAQPEAERMNDESVGIL